MVKNNKINMLSSFLIFGFGFLMFAMIYWAAIILLISFTLWMAVDAAKHDRFWWIVGVVTFPFLGALVYYYKKKHKKNHPILEEIKN